MTRSEGKLKILFLEDIPTDVEIAVRELQKHEIEFIYKVAEDRLCFEELLSSFCPDMVISDFMLPTVNGLEALKISLDTNPTVPVIILTGSMNEETAVACMKAGAWDYVVKDFIVKLPFAVKEALEKRREVSDLQDKLKADRDKYRLLFESNPLPMWVYDVETLNFIDVNKAAIRKYGYTSEEFLKMNLKDIRPDEDIQMLIRNVQNSTEDYERTSGWRHKLKDGSIINVEIVSHNIEFDGVRCRMVLANDITQRVKDEQLRREMMVELQKSEERYRRFFEEDLTADYISTRDGELIDCNEAYVKMFGFSDKEHALSTRAMRLYENPEEREVYIRLIEEKGGVERHEITYRSLQGQKIYSILNSFGHFDEDGRLQRIQGYIFDITDIKKAAIEMREARELAEKSNKLKDAFIANISHEIRTPMNAIIGFIGIIKESIIDKDNKELAEYFNVIDEAGARLMRTVDLILSLSKLQAGVMETRKSEIDPEKEIASIISHHRPASEKKSLPIKLINNSGIRKLVTDEYCFTEVISNFVDNAIKYTDKGEIRIEMELRKGGDLVISVIDTGIGIDKQFQGKLFQPFVQEETGYSRSYEGVGLGLSIVKRFAELSGYEIEFESEKGKGSRFSLILPENLFKESAGKTKTGKREESIDSDTKEASSGNNKIKNGDKPLIYAVEDDEDSQVYLKTILSAKYNLEIASTDRELFAMLETKLPSVILMDISLRGSRDGLEITKVLKADNRYIGIPVIAVTAHAFQSDRINALDAGCAGFLSKPYSPGELFKLIIEAINER